MSPKHTHTTTLPLARNPAARARSGPAAYARAARRYNIDSPVFVARDGVVFQRQTQAPDGPASEVAAQDVENDLEYVVAVTVGTPGVVLHLDLDTGSSDLWVWSSELRGSAAGHTIYNPSASSTAKQVDGATWSISYGDGSSASGNVYTDTIQVGALTIHDQAIELAEELSSSFLQGKSDGLLGLAWPRINTVKPSPVLTPVANMIQQGVPGVFSVALDHGDAHGFYTFGGLDPAKAGVQETDIAYTPVDTAQGFWMFASASARVAGTTIAQPGNTAILDTGTTLLLVADATAAAVYAAVPGARMDAQRGGWVYPAGAHVPAVALAVGDALCEVALAYGDAGGGMVFGGIQSRGNSPFDIFGDVFLKGVYAVFDAANARVGVAQRNGNVAA